MEKRRAFITGVTGQDGTYLSAFLLDRGYEVYGVDAQGHVPRVSLTGYQSFDIRDREALHTFLREAVPHGVYHLAAFHRSSAQTLLSVDLDTEERGSWETNVLSVQTILSTLSAHVPHCRVFLAGSCHMFGEAQGMPQSEQTPFKPTNIYAVTKVAATLLGRLYREQKRLFVCTGILYNHDSPWRGPDFVTARIAKTVVDILHGRASELVLGCLDAQVDWGFAGDYVEAMYAMLQAPSAEDFIIASGELHTVEEFARIAFARVGLDGQKYMREDAHLYKPVSSCVYQGDTHAIQTRLGWKPKTSFSSLVRMMVDHYLSLE